MLDFICAGVVQSSVLNQMEAASMAGGFGSSMRPEMPLHVCYVCVGNGPTVGVFWAEDESESLRISDMVRQQGLALLAIYNLLFG